MLPVNWSSLITLLLLSGSGCSNAGPADRAEELARSGDHKQPIELHDHVTPTSKDPAAFVNRAITRATLGDLDAALRDYDAALQLIAERSPGGGDPFLPMTYYNRGVAYQMAGKCQPAIKDFEKTIALNPDYPDAAHNLAWIFATSADETIRNGKRALELALGEVQKSPNNPNALDTLAAAYAATGDFANAITTQEKALTKCFPDQKQRFSARLDLFRANKSYVEAP